MGVGSKFYFLLPCMEGRVLKSNLIYDDKKEEIKIRIPNEPMQTTISLYEENKINKESLRCITVVDDKLCLIELYVLKILILYIIGEYFKSKLLKDKKFIYFIYDISF